MIQCIRKQSPESRGLDGTRERIMTGSEKEIKQQLKQGKEAMLTDSGKC
jgi:hypothetical protein